MIDDSMGNVLNKYLEGLLVRQDAELKGLLGERDKAFLTIAKKDEQIEALMTHINHLTNTIDTFAADKVRLLSEVAAYKTNMEPLNRLIDLLEEEVNDSEHEVLALKEHRVRNHETIDRLNAVIKGLSADRAGMERVIKNLENQVLAVQIQAAESEYRADEEKRGRLQLVMRL